MSDRPRGRPRTVLLLGATSEIGLATVRALDLAPGSTMFLSGRDEAAITSVAGTFPGMTVRMDHFDATDPDSVASVIHRAFDTAPIDVVLPVFGVLGDQPTFESDPATSADLITINVVAQTRALLEAAMRLRRQGHGTLVVLSSVAAVRPRQANFVYGASKAALDAVAQGLSDSLRGTGVHVLLVRPGFVIGRMTAGMPRAPLATTPQVVGQEIADAIDTGKPVLWVPPMLRVLAAAMRLVPRPVWRRIRR